jgi:cytochrome c peroxidase
MKTTYYLSKSNIQKYTSNTFKKFNSKQLLTMLLILFSSHLLAQEPITPIPLVLDTDPNKVLLGKKLFSDTILSSNNTISCESCHGLKTKFGTDLTAVSTGVNGKQGVRNSPTVYNSVFNFAQFWDGRANNLTHQAMEPITNPLEMGMASWGETVKKIKKSSEYKELYDAAYDGEITKENTVNAIAEFGKTLITPNSIFDQYLRGNKDMITSEQKIGYDLFKSYGCIACHQGINVGGNMFQKFGVAKDINFIDGTLNKDLGRYDITGNEWDKRVFKVPSLRLAVKTPPYFHDGSVATIDEAVAIMIEFQLGRKAPKKDKQAIIRFLESLVGEIPVGVK